MRKSSPKPYENLLYEDYPEKNAAKVNALALRNITADESKDQIANKINEQIQPLVDEQTASMASRVKLFFKKIVEKSVEQAVNRSVDLFIEKMKKRDQQASTKTQ